MTAAPVLSPGVTLETERLRLRPPLEADFEAEAAFWASPRAEFVGGPLPRHRAWRALAALAGHWAWRGYGFFAVEEKATGAFCGRVGPWFPIEWPEPEIGWTVMPEAEGRGIAREAALAARDWARDTLGWARPISLIDARNLRSQRLAERLGCTREGVWTHPCDGWAAEVWRHPATEVSA